MKAGDVNAARPSTQDSWYSTPLSDPNAALWASITPPANPSLRAWLDKRLASVSLDVLAQRLQRALPSVFASNASAQRGVLGAVAALGASVGLAGYVALGSLGPVEGSAALASAAGTASAGVRAGTTLDDGSAARAAVAAAPARVGEVLADSPTTTLASTAKPGAEQVVQALQAEQAGEAEQQPGAAADEPQLVTAKTKKAKRAAAKRKAKQRAALKRAASKPRRQAAFKFN